MATSIKMDDLRRAKLKEVRRIYGKGEKLLPMSQAVDKACEVTLNLAKLLPDIQLSTTYKNMIFGEKNVKRFERYGHEQKEIQKKAESREALL